MADCYGDVEAAEVGDNADTEGLDAAVVSNDNFGNGAHADSVAAQNAVHTVFGWRFEGGTLNTYIDAMLHRDGLLLCYLIGKGYQLVVVGFVHVGETRTGREVLAIERMFGEAVDVVGDNHQVANLKLRIHTA